MNQEIHNFNQELVKTISESIFKKEITSIKRLEDIAFRLRYKEKDAEDVREILNIFFKEGIIEYPLQNLRIQENDFLVNMHKINELERENLI
ncbi:hypothetical protein CPZ17_09900 [Staphylococcus epidermidis]|uniref:hypothetical protein n=1 Tax=Staphylococcus epidermidis TaxID=1282 RepID=UPI000C16B442|nr:hypothetical protein [Staphylococcus epidermidis]ATQ50741.1 hypothetical protein CPZ17_09900 [Staphylococcus epidermidis]